MKKSYCLVLIGFIMIFALGFAERGEPKDKKVISLNTQSENILKTYVNKKYHITLKYPSDWKLNPLYSERYEGKEGFFQVGAIDGQNLPIDTVADNDAFHQLRPYGSAPKITKLKIQEQEARLILPSEDQPKEMKNQAGLIIKYPKPVKIGNTNYYYFELWADKAHIEQIGKTITFSDNSSED